MTDRDRQTDRQGETERDRQTDTDIQRQRKRSTTDQTCPSSKKQQLLIKRFSPGDFVKACRSAGFLPTYKYRCANSCKKETPRARQMPEGILRQLVFFDIISYIYSSCYYFVFVQMLMEIVTQ